MSEITDYYNKAKRKYEAGNNLYESEFYSESIVHYYYSMFLLSKILLFRKDLESRTHEGTIYLLKKHYVDTGELDEKFYKGLATSETLRNQVDYGSIDEISEPIAREKRNICSKYLTEVKKILDND